MFFIEFLHINEYRPVCLAVKLKELKIVALVFIPFYSIKFGLFGKYFEGVFLINNNLALVLVRKSVTLS